MKIKIYTLLSVYFVFLNFAGTQSSYRLTSGDVDIRITEVIEVATPPSALATSNPMICIGSNYSYLDGRGDGVLLSQLDQRLSSIKSYKIFGQRSHLAAKDLVSTGSDYFILGDIGNSGIFISKISNAGVPQWSKSFHFAQGGNQISAVDLLFANNQFYLLTNVQTEASNPSGFLITQLAEDGRINWSKWFTGSSITSHHYFGSSLTFSSDRSILVSGRRVSMASEFDKEIFLLKLNESGESQIQKTMIFYNSFGKRMSPGIPYLDVNGINLHLVVQAVDPGNVPGNLTVTMIDNDLNIRTWRNYSPMFRVEEFKIGSNKFLLSGQNTGRKSGNGYAMVGINNANAIPEIVDYYQSGFENSSHQGSSSLGFHRSWQKYLMASRPDNGRHSEISFSIRPERQEAYCADTFSFTVTKDPIDNEESLDLISENVGLETSELQLIVEPFEQRLEVICNLTSTEELASKFNIFPTIATDRINILNHDGINFQTMITGLDGKVVYKQAAFQKEHIDISDFPDGIYFLQLTDLLTAKSYTAKFIKKD
ncbi:MAG: T9SS type A sorting domain-containing protein [Saprospiraceae bacterium]|nr:T9SS type A sorting domain-containing protein [Saprospiraceae bacterium]